ncbi:MAG: WD40/YVTN/BNR-like repeat-containing protein, partial [Pyrinomonadaceae bacterium]
DRNGQWKEHRGKYGGVGGSSEDGKIFVGGGGLVGIANGGEWKISKLPLCGELMLYTAATSSDRIFVAGDFGFVGTSVDFGQTWKCNQVKKDNTLVAIYGLAVRKDVVLAGGGQGALWWSTTAAMDWQRIDGLSKDMAVFAVYLSDDAMTAFAGGGDEAGSSPFVISTINGGADWSSEVLSSAHGRVISFARGQGGLLFAATLDGHILIRHEESTH